MTDFSSLKASSQGVLNEAACDATITNWMQAVLDFVGMVTSWPGLKGTKETCDDLKSQKPQNDGGSTVVADWFVDAIKVLDAMAADYA